MMTEWGRSENAAQLTERLPPESHYFATFGIIGVMNTENTAEYTEVGGIRLLDGEEIYLMLDGRYGLLHGAPPQDDFVVVTNQRLICFAHKDGKNRRVLLPIGGVESVEVTDLGKNIRPLVSGGLMLLAAIGVSWAAAVVGWSGILPWIIAAVLVALGALTASSYFVSEDSPSITFRTRTTEVSLSLRGDAALRDAYRLANGPFQVQAGQTPAVEQSSTGKDETATVAPWWSLIRTAPSAAATVADKDGDWPVEPSSGDPSTTEDALLGVSATAEDEGSAAPEEEPPTEDVSPVEEAPHKVRETTAREAAAHLGINRATITRWARKNPLLVVRYPEKRGQAMIVDLEAVLAHARSTRAARAAWESPRSAESQGGHDV